MSDYLWDKSGSDREVESLERLLRPLALPQGPSFALPGDGATEGGAAVPRFRRRFPAGRWGTALAAAGLMALGVTAIVIRDARRPAYTVDTDSGRFTVTAGSDVAAGGTERRIDLGDGIGTVVAEANARLRVLRISEETHRLQLVYGTIHARISAEARPRLFQVQTPATTCVDLGCRYTLSVDGDGGSSVVVESGRVAFEDGGREVFIPEGAGCRAVPGRGSGTPLWTDAPEPLKAAVRVFDEAPAGRRASQAQDVAAKAAQPRDALVLWHFLQDPEDGVVEAGVDALIAMAPPPPGVTREASLRRDPEIRLAWKRHLFPEWDW